MINIVILAGLLITLVTAAPVLAQMRREHPRGLFVLFFAEMWERFSYYGMRGLLVFYLTEHFLVSDKEAAGTYGAYTTLVYLLPLVGGVIADRWLGARKAVAFGALLLVVGQLTLAFGGHETRQVLETGGRTYEFQVTGRAAARDVKLKLAGQAVAFKMSKTGDLDLVDPPANAPLPAHLAKDSFTLKTVDRDEGAMKRFYLALSIIIMGVGFLKSNISAIVGKLYGEGDPRRDPGFTLFYFGINMGAFWAAILCGYLGEQYGWSYGFGAAGVGMAVGFVTFVLGKPLLDGHGETTQPELLNRKVLGPITTEWATYAVAVLGILGVWLLVQRSAVVGAALGVGVLAAVGYVGWVMATQCDRVQRERLLLAFVLTFGAVVFFTLFEQAGTSLNLYAERNTDLRLIDAPIVFDILGRHVFIGSAAMHPPAGALWIDAGFNAAQTQSFNAGFILLLAPMFSALWAWLGKRGLDPDPVTKFGLGLAQVGLGFLVIVASAGMADSSWRLPLLVLAATYFFHTTGEMCLSPVGLSEITKLAPATLVSTLLSLWFLAASAGQFISARIAQLAGGDKGGLIVDAHETLVKSLGVFQSIGWAGVGIGVGFLILARFVRNWAHPVKAG